MKLLGKKDIDKGKASDRRLEVAEGMKLATKVDALRELQAKEQANLIKFRNGSLMNVRKEVDEEISRRDSFRSENEVLSERNKKLREPLDAEWAKLASEAKSVTIIRLELAERSEIMKSNEKEIIETRKHLESEEERTCEDRQRALQELSDASKAKEEARKSLQQALEKSNAIYSHLALRIEGLDAREKGLEQMASEVKSQEERNEIERRAILKEKQRLADREAMVERSLKRI